MFCPRCAAENTEGAQFCRGCGANISLVPRAVSGELEEPAGKEDGDSRRGRPHRRRRGEDVTIERAVRSLFMGIAFILVAFSARVWAPGGHFWWFWLFLPAAGLLGDSVSTYLRLRERRARFAPPAHTTYAPTFAPPPHAARLPERGTGELAHPPSVTEATTKHLGAPSPRRREDA